MPEQRTMTLDELLSACSREHGLAYRVQPGSTSASGEVGRGEGPARVEIRSLAYDSSRVEAGALFFCVPGERHDGHDFAAHAIERGAGALVVERHLGLGVPEVLVDSVRAAMGPLAAGFFGEPSVRLRVAGITGTNGKTTTTFLLRELFEAAGTRCGLLGTVKSVIAGAAQPAGRTTPEAIDLQRDLRMMLDGGDGACALEVSSHALALGRTQGLHFAAAVFTNLTQDHLDFHDSMESYFQAKRALFLTEPGACVVNVGDNYGRRLAADLPAAVTFAVADDGEGLRADYRASEVRCDGEGSHFKLSHPDGSCQVMLAMPGRFNVANALGALAAARSMGIALEVIVERLARSVHVPGRFQPVTAGQDFDVLVDYAHTPDSLARVLSSARDLITAGVAPDLERRLICVFGAGGDRDRGKRPLMGEAATRIADLVVVTSDNPRSEQPAAIVEQIMAGVADGPGAEESRVHVVLDRRLAIGRALELAQAGDVVVIAGKGHEQGQEFAGGRTIPFDDVTVAREELERRLCSPARPRSRPSGPDLRGAERHVQGGASPALRAGGRA
jgi:UDP-N-acetylmuramoyl-L-alanyl-D-glutamate--2,6-diaminopimelate ligase